MIHKPIVLALVPAVVVASAPPWRRSSAASSARCCAAKAAARRPKVSLTVESAATWGVSNFLDGDLIGFYRDLMGFDRVFFGI